MNRFFAPGGEFSRIERLFPAARFSADARGPGDDGFLWEPAPGVVWTATSDSSAENVHYRLDWVPPARALRKALLAALSDVNAMGGRSRHVLFNLGARADWGSEVFDAFAETLAGLEAEFGFRVSGGDTVTLPDSSFFSFSVLGEVKGQPLLRSACKPGQRVYVSGFLGGSAAGLRLLKRGGGSGKDETRLIAAHLDPAPPLELGPALAALGRGTAAVDLSDGLSSEAWHLARRSGCSLRLDWEKLPAHPALTGVDAEEVRDGVLNGGEEYQLLFTGEFPEKELDALRAIVPIAEIGAVEAGEGVFLSEGGVTKALPAGGFAH